MQNSGARLLPPKLREFSCIQKGKCRDTYMTTQLTPDTRDDQGAHLCNRRRRDLQL